MNTNICTAEDIIKFWFNELTPKDWFKKDQALDEKIKKRFGATHSAAVFCELFSWRTNPQGRLAEIVVLDQFSRNIFRDDKSAFAADALALALAQEAVSHGADRELEPSYKAFMYMPYMHSESRLIHEQSVRLFDQPGLESNLDFEMKHKSIIDRFGRFPHRNKILQRESTREEIEFLKEPNSSF